jgi:hypothetical protein
MANEFPKIDKKNEGKFKAWIKNNMKGTDTCSAASKIMSNKDDYSQNVVDMANYAKNMGCKSKGGPKQKSSAKDPSGDGKYTKKDFLINIGVLDKEGNKIDKKKK